MENYYEDTDFSSVEQFIFNEVVNREEKIRRSRIKSKFISTRGKNSDDDREALAPRDRQEYKKAHNQHQKDIIDGKSQANSKSHIGYTRLYGKDGKRAPFELPKGTATPARKKGVFSARSDDQAEQSKYRLAEIKERSSENKTAQTEKGIPHKGTIDKIANKIRNKQVKAYEKVADRITKSKNAPDIMKEYISSPLVHNSAYFNYLKAAKGEKEAHNAMNRISPGVQNAYAIDKAATKGAKKLKSVAKKFVDRKLKNNRSAKSEDTFLVSDDDSMIMDFDYFDI